MNRLSAPHSGSMLDEHGIEEERRLCYGPMTRAVQRLVGIVELVAGAQGARDAAALLPFPRPSKEESTL